MVKVFLWGRQWVCAMNVHNSVVNRIYWIIFIYRCGRGVVGIYFYLIKRVKKVTDDESGCMFWSVVESRMECNISRPVSLIIMFLANINCYACAKQWPSSFPLHVSFVPPNWVRQLKGSPRDWTLTFVFWEVNAAPCVCLDLSKVLIKVAGVFMNVVGNSHHHQLCMPTSD